MNTCLVGLENQLPLNIIDDAPDKKTCRRSWAQLVYQVFEINPLKCLKCGAQMKIIAFILKREEVIRILKHLEMWPIEYSEPCPVEARALPKDFVLLQKLTDSRHLK